MNLAIFLALLPILLLIGPIWGRDQLLAGAELFDRITLAGLVAYVALTNLLIMAFNMIPLSRSMVAGAARGLSGPLGRERA